LLILGLNESTTNFINIPENQMNAGFKLQTRKLSINKYCSMFYYSSKSYIITSLLDLVSDIENVDNIEETSPEFEPLTSVLDNDNSNDESISGMSDLVSVGSPVQIVSKENNDTTSNGFETNTNPIENLLQTPFDKNGIVNHKIKNTNNESNSTNFISNNSEKLKTNDLKSKSKHHSSRTSGHTNSEDKSSSNRSKNRNSNNHRSTSREKNDVKKRSNSSSKDRKNGSHTKHRSNSKDKDKKNKHKKSHQTDRDKTSKRDRKDSRSDKKEKSSSLCKEPKSLNGNRSDDESNAGGSSKQKSSINKNKSSTSEKSKSSSNQKDNSSKEVVNKSKDKSSMSSSSHSSSQINNETNKKRHKHAVEDKFNNSNIVERKIKVTNNQNSSMTYKEQDAVNTLLSIGFTTTDISQNNSKIFVKNSIMDKILNNMDTAEGVIDVEENIDQIFSSSVDNKQENINSIKDCSKSSQPFDSIGNVSKIDASKTNSSFHEGCVVDVKKTLPCKNQKLETNFNECVEIYSEANKHNELIVDKKEVKTNNAEINLISGANQITNMINTTLTVPKPKLLPNQIDAMKRKRYSKNNESKAIKKMSLVSSSEINVLVDDNISQTVSLEQNDKQFNCDADSKIMDSSVTSTNTLDKGHDNIDTQTLSCEASFNGFKGFSSTNGFYCKHYERLINIIKTLKEEETQQSNIDEDGFKGFDNNTSTPCKYRDIVYGQLIKEMEESTGFKGFTEDEVQRCDGYESVKNQLKLEQKTKEKQQKTITHGENGIQSEKTINKVIALMYKSKNDNDTTQNENFSQPDGDVKKDCPVVNNNNHDITPSDQWVVEQEMKYKLLPVKVKLERLMGYRCTSEYN